MAKKSRTKKSRRLNPPDATLRNVRAANGRMDALEERVRELEKRVDILAANRPEPPA